jgi:hypothetical protein
MLMPLVETHSSLDGAAAVVVVDDDDVVDLVGGGDCGCDDIDIDNDCRFCETLIEKNNKQNQTNNSTFSTLLDSTLSAPGEG